MTSTGISFGGAPPAILARLACAARASGLESSEAGRSKAGTRVTPSAPNTGLEALLWSARALEVVGFRADLLPVEAQIANVFDRYAFVRDAWAQRREYMIFDGSPPEPTFDDEPLDDEPVAPAAPAP